MKDDEIKELPFINVHTHIFTGDDVPPYLAKKFVPSPLHRLLHVGFLILIFSKAKWFKDNVWRKIIQFQTLLISGMKTSFLFRYLGDIVSYYFFINLLVFLIKLSNPKTGSFFSRFFQWLDNVGLSQLLLPNISWIYIGLMGGVLMLLFPHMVAYLWFLSKKILSPLKSIPSKKSLEFLQRYFQIVEFVKYENQKVIFDRLIKMYPKGSKVVVLAMDMTYMQAGSPKRDYLEQLRDLDRVISKQQKNTEFLVPFVFVDPRRIRESINDSNPFFKWKMNAQNEVQLLDCVLKELIEGKNDVNNGNFKGIKLYPALGYYPFDEDLLPLYLYCIKHEIPITTHCIQGTIFYRGYIKKEWMHHPIFETSKGKPMPTRVRNNYELQVNFTHPLNYLVLLDPVFLKKKVKTCRKEIQELFGYNKGTDSLKYDLKTLKINLAHYGGDDHWQRYLNADRNDASVDLIENPNHGTNLSQTGEKEYSKPAYHWSKNTEWFTLISSLLLQYPNVYSDISYILHNQKMRPLLKHILITNKKLSNKILFGTDFFVVRNHKSEKEIYADMMASLGEEHMDKIGRVNNHAFLKSSYYK